jgi:hypothetical protein
MWNINRCALTRGLSNAKNKRDQDQWTDGEVLVKGMSFFMTSANGVAACKRGALLYLDSDDISLLKL